MLSLLGCSSSALIGWNNTNNNKFVWDGDEDSLIVYNWNGAYFDKVINGKGTLTTYKDDNTTETKQITAIYGATDSSLVTHLKDGSLYVGNVINDTFNGFGVYIKGQDIYIGTFLHSKPNGQLNWYKNEKLFYSGTWLNGEFNGKGTLYKADGSIKRGTWKNNKLIQTYVKRQTALGLYKGYILNGTPDGYGMMAYNDSSTYKGDWVHGKWEGKGTYISATDTIIGEWKRGKINGETSIKLFRLKYNGDCIDNRPDGFGTMQQSNFTYSGEWSEGKADGYGEINYANKDCYYGDWKDNNFNGYGRYEYQQTGDYYDGQWINGLQHGLGSYHSKNIDYAGNWVNGWIHGKGKVVYSTGDWYEGQFAENRLSGRGYYHFKNGNAYNGEFNNGKINGLGTFYFKNGDVYRGEFIDGKIRGDGTLYITIGKEQVAITANWNGSHKLPKYASVLFNNGDLYEGEIVNGHPTSNGTWRKIKFNNYNGKYDILTQTNNLYKKHKATWDKISNTTSIVLGAVEIAAPFVGGALILTGVGAPVGATIITIGQVAGVANNVILSADASVKIASASIDIRDDVKNRRDPSGSIKNATVELATTAALFAAPKVLKKVGPKLAPFIKRGVSYVAKFSKRSLIILSKKKAFAKIITLVQNKKGLLVKRAITPGKFIKPVVTKFKSSFLHSKMLKSILYRQYKEILKKGPIELKQKDLDYLLKSGDDAAAVLRNMIKTYTGDKKNFQEFFIRLSMNNKETVKKILSHPKIKDYIKKSIRSANVGNHEWLMTKNFESFLTDPKWGEDGPFLALSLTKLVQRTESVLFRNGGGHVSSGRLSSRESIQFHIGLAKVIDQCSSKEELFLNVKAYAKSVLSKESYNEFKIIFINVFK